MPVTVRIDGLGELLDQQFSVASRGQLMELGMKDTDAARAVHRRKPGRRAQ